MKVCYTRGGSRRVRPGLKEGNSVLFARAVFYAEVLLNGLSAVFTFLAPAAFAAQFTPAALPPVGLEFLRWYGVLLAVFVYMEWAALRSPRPELLRAVTTGFLIGDLLHLVACYRFLAVAGWTPAFAFMVASTVALPCVRALWLWLDRR